MFAISFVITAVVFMAEDGIAQVVPSHWVRKDRDSIFGRSKRLFSSLKRPAWLLGPVSNLCNGHRVHFLPLVKAAGTWISPLISTWCWVPECGELSFYYTMYLHGIAVKWAQPKVFPLYLHSFTGVVLHAKDYTFMLGDHRMCFKILHAFTGNIFLQPPA